ncbi:hypothetical protein Sm713_41300 [Streptomyces sp. TS71-3]|nr:hypothetical protein Sm713_41300 [Streptomyces sp. TS71-3]
MNKNTSARAVAGLSEQRQGLGLESGDRLGPHVRMGRRGLNPSWNIHTSGRDRRCAITELADAVVSFPSVVFTPVLVVLVGFWLLVLLNPSQRPGFGFHQHADGLGVRRIPVLATASIVLALAWLFSLAGSLLLRRADAGRVVYGVLSTVVLVCSLALAWTATRVLLHAWRRRRRPGRFPPHNGSRRE